MKHRLFILLSVIGAIGALLTHGLAAPDHIEGGRATQHVDVPPGCRVVFVAIDGGAVQPSDLFSANANSVMSAVRIASPNLEWLDRSSTNHLATLADLRALEAKLGTMATEDQWLYPHIWDFSRLVDKVDTQRQLIEELLTLREEMEALRARYGAMDDRLRNTRPCTCP